MFFIVCHTRVNIIFEYKYTHTHTHTHTHTQIGQGYNYSATTSQRCGIPTPLYKYEPLLNTFQLNKLFTDVYKVRRALSWESNGNV